MNLLDFSDPADFAKRDRMEQLALLRDYYDGMHARQLRVKFGKFDDNLTVNLCGLITDKAVSALVGDPADGRGLSWAFPSETGMDESGNEVAIKPPAITWLNELWDKNHRDAWLHLNALQGAMTGIPALKIVTNGHDTNFRISQINPLTLTVETDPNDIDKVTKYTILYSVKEGKKEVTHKEETYPANDQATAWIIEKTRKISGNRWEAVEPPIVWPYDFPPILTWQNLPVLDSPYGRSDIEGIIPIQDRYNFLVSNLSKIIRLYAHPQRYGLNLSPQMEEGLIKMGPDEMPMLNSSGSNTSEIIQMPPVGDLPGAMAFLQSLRESAFMLSREVDTMSMKDKVGAITNFALRVLYRDFLDKLGTKRLLYGQAYQELNRRLLILGGFEGEICEIIWPDPLPVNETEETTALTSDLTNKLVSVQTAQEIRGYDHEKEEERMGNESQGTQDAGALLLQGFFKNGGAQNNTKVVNPAEQGIE
jgi:hypothetical protein